MARVRFLLVLAAILLGALLAAPRAQTLSSQVLQLLTRTNTWTGQQTFQNLRLSVASPSDTANRLYNISGALYWNGALIAGGGGGPAIHNILSASHGDVTIGTVVRGDVLIGVSGPTWNRLGIGTAGAFLRSDGTDVAWGTDGSQLTTLNASQLTSGTLPLARLSGITNNEIAGAAGISWSKLDKTGSSLADLTTRSAGDLTSGSLADARLSANVSLFGSSVETSEITNGTILFADWADNGCSSGQFPQLSGSTWVCASITPGTGTVTSVALTVPAIFSVAGSPVTGSGTLAVSLATQSANLVWAGPSTGSAAAPTFRSLVYADFPTSAAAAGTYPKVTINGQGIVTGTATQITLTTDVTGVLPLANGGTGLNAAADDSVLLSNGSVWAAAALSNCTTGLTYATATNTFGCAASVGSHALLSASHSDTLAASVARGDLIVGSSVPQWTRLALGATNGVLVSNGSDPSWDTTPTVDGLTVSLPLGTLVVGTGSNPNQIVLQGQVQPAAGISDGAILYTGTVAETFTGTHGALYAHDFNGTFTPGLAATTTAATMHVGALTGSTATTTYGILADTYIAATLGYYERSRTVRMGEWTTRTFAAGNYTANGSMTWTVASGDVLAESFTEIGTTQILNFALVTTTVAGTLNTQLRVTLPNSRTASRTTTGICSGIDNSTLVTPMWQVTAGATYVEVYKDSTSTATWAAATDTTNLRCNVTVAF